MATDSQLRLGATLARMETGAMLECVAGRWLLLQIAALRPVWWGVGPFRGLSRLRIAPD